jgi:hypothetical protein
MIRNYYIYMLGIALLVAGCRRQDEPGNNNGEPFFAMAGNIDNQPVKLIAGEGFYMQPGYYKDSVNMLVFTGNLKEDCTGCKRSLSIYIRNSRPDTQGMVNIMQSFPLMDYPFSGSAFPQQCRVTFEYTGSGSGTPANSWRFSDNTTYSTDTFTKVFSIPSATIVSCSTQYPGCSSVIESPVFFREWPAATNLDFTVSQLDPLGTMFRFTATGIDNQTGYLEWQFGDGQSETGQEVEHTYTDTLPGIKAVRLTQFKTAIGDTNSISRNIAILNYSGCVSNFRIARTYIDDPFMFSGVTVEWTDESGTTYSSSKVVQDAASKFTITGVSEYIPDQAGHKTLALDLRINCKVSDGTRTIELRNLSGRMAIAYP